MSGEFVNYDRGIASLGLPVVPGIVNLPPYQGKVWFVDAARGSNGNNGRSPARAVATIQKAHDLAKAGDAIYVFPGSYVENVIVSKDYLSLIGAVQGYGRPDIGPASGMALHVDNAQGFVARGLRFFSEGALVDLTATAGRLVRIEGNGFLFDDCVFDGDSGDHANSILVGLKGDADDDAYTASEGRILRSLFRGAAGRALAFETGEPPTNGVGSSHCEILGCRFISNTGIDIVTRASFAGGGTYSVQDVLIAYCKFMAAKNKATWIDLTTSKDGAASDQTGQIADCDFADDDLEGTNAIKMTGTGFTLVRCADTVGIQDGSGFD